MSFLNEQNKNNIVAFLLKQGVSIIVLILFSGYMGWKDYQHQDSMKEIIRDYKAQLNECYKSQEDLVSAINNIKDCNQKKK